MSVIKVHGSDDPSTYSVYASDGLPAGAVAIPNATSSTPGVATAAPSFVFPPTSGAPVTTPASGTPAYDAATNKLYIYNGAAWKSVTLA